MPPEQVKAEVMVKAIFTESGGSAGARTVVTIATTREVPLSRYRADKIMKNFNLKSCQQPKYAYKRGRNKRLDIPNLLDRQVAVVMDLFSRKVIGWAMSHSPDTTLTAKALIMAFESRRMPKGVMFHSCQGCHYTSKK
ncbi:MAG: putative transposase [Cognaticolwellia sp.]